MEPSPKTPESNVDIVSANLVKRAMVDEVKTPGEPIAKLFEQMVAVSRNIGGDHRAAATDWADTVAGLGAGSDGEAEALVKRQELAFGDTWAQHWMLMHLAKRLAYELELRCLNSPAAAAIKSVNYNDDGTIAKWSLRSK